MNDTILVFQTFPWTFYLSIFLLAICIGSFLNVVIYRLPVMMERQWKCDCRELLEEELKDPAKQDDKAVFNLVKPDSTCPACQSPIKARHNIPVLGWLLLKGKCYSCKNTISVRYPIVELFTGVCSLVIAYHFGISWELIPALIFTWYLITLSLIDIDTMMLPDELNFQLLWGGLLVSIWGFGPSMEQAIFGAVFGYLSLWSVYWAFKLLTGKEGMGYGDFKLMAALGAWLGVSSIPVLVLLSSVLGAIIGIIFIILKGKDKNLPIPFGPYIAAAGWIYLMWGENIVNAYWNYVL